jgi:uncharacterized protein (DUF1800 family)
MVLQSAADRAPNDRDSLEPSARPFMNSFVCRTVWLGVCALGFALPATAAEFDQRLINLSTRAQVGVGANAPVVGFVIGDGAPKRVLIRAVGPTLGGAPYNVPGVLANPRLELYSGSSKIADNDNWTTTSVGGSTTFASVGAFGLPAGSADAALIATLGPGNYSAQVTGVGTANTGAVLLEVYDVTGAARLMNLSTRALVSGAGSLISGLAVAPGGGVRKILVRAAGPTLGSIANLPGTLSDPSIAVIDANGVTVASNDDWGTGNAAALSTAFANAGAFAFLAGSKDAALIVDLAPNSNYSIQVNGVGNTTGLAIVEVYDITANTSGPSVSVAATTASTDSKGGAPAVFTITRTGSTAAPLTVYYSVGGTAVAGVDYASLSGSVTIPAGASSATVQVVPQNGPAILTINKDVALTLVSGPAYAVDGVRTAAVTIFYNPGSLYVTALRPSSGVTSTAFGMSTIQLSDDNTFAIVNLSFSNLSSPETVAYLRYGNPGEVGIELIRLPNGQVNGQIWAIQGSGALTAADIIQGIKDGRVFVSIESATYPAGELRGAYIQSSGSGTFVPPAPAPTLPDTGLAASDVSRFLIQATFGPTKAEIDALAGKRFADLNNWISAQIATPASLLLTATRADFDNYTLLNTDDPRYTSLNRQAAWWKIALTAPDQLRQRVAFALSEIFVVSDVPSELTRNPLALANYYDILVRGSFGNFRQVLEEVTLSPVMGFYLSHLRNRKASGTALPDENYAREVMQLFTIGLNQLNADGTLKLDALGLPIPTYDQKTITEMAKVFTGWSFATTQVPASFNAVANWIEPMMLFPAQHEDSAKAVVGGVVIPANQGGVKDLKDALDALFNHANTGPFISRQLIQRLVTSNPSPAYVYRVAQVFANNGSGVRGDLGAVVRAILMDYEARSPAIAATASFGKLKEPLLRATALLRAFDGGANNGRFQYPVAQNGESALGQTTLHAPTVFNFFEPDFIQPGTLATAGLFAPEYQILTDTAAISLPNQLWNWTYANRSTIDPANTTIGFKFDSALLALARTPQALVDRVNLVLAGGGLPKAITDRFVAAIAAMPNNTAATDLERVRSAIYLTVSVPQGAIQK